MPHFFINSNDVKENSIIISEVTNYRHIAKSLRIKPGEKLLLIDENQIQYETTVNEITNKEIFTNIDKKYKSKRFLDFDLYLAQSPLHSDAQSLLIEKSTELGVNTIIPILTDNCVVSKSIIEKKIPKWQKIMYESSKQCERASIPTCLPLTKLQDLIKDNKFDKILVFCERIASRTIRDSLAEKPISSGDKVLVIIGPEGGFSQNEFDYFQKNNLEMLTLGQLILRAETATTVALGNIIYEYSTCDRKN